MSMACTAGEHLAQVVVRELLTLASQLDRPVVVGISGYPYTGKTRLRHDLAGAWPIGNAIVLATEVAVLTREWRQDRRIDGCAEAGHDMDLLLDLLDSVLAGRPVRAPMYSWLLGRHVDYIDIAGAGRNDLVIVDGTVAASPRVAARCDRVLFLSPAAPTPWLHLAGERDVQQRAWPRENVESENVKKYATAAALRAHTVADGVIRDIVVDPSTWRVRLVSCARCDVVIGHREEEAAISEALCQLGQ